MKHDLAKLLALSAAAQKASKAFAKELIRAKKRTTYRELEAATGLPRSTMFDLLKGKA